ncbi:hypothetical protein [Archangium sp.]|uniref:hypothetical protein n=1 Tax=Archangium sp. TaxID=1872627 RepID=UPI00286C4327|nr:hypothetical protein [Archangium sp.]
MSCRVASLEFSDTLAGHLLVRGAKARSFRVPKEDNPELRVACDGKRSFQQGTVDKKPNPLCKPARKPARKPVVRKRK